MFEGIRNNYQLHNFLPVLRTSLLLFRYILLLIYYILLLYYIYFQDGFGELTISKHSQSGSHGGAKTTPDHLSPTIQEEEEGRDETDDKDDDSVFERDIGEQVVINSW